MGVCCEAIGKATCEAITGVNYKKTLDVVGCFELLQGHRDFASRCREPNSRNVLVASARTTQKQRSLKDRT